MARGVSRSIAWSKAASATAWSAASAAVGELCGALPPDSVGVLAGGRRHDRAEVRLRKLAVYTAVVGIGVHAVHIAACARLSRAWIWELLRDVEERRDDDAELDALLDRLAAVALVRMRPTQHQTTDRAA